MPDNCQEGILKGLYRFKPTTKTDAKLRAQLLGSGTIMYEVLKAQQILEETYGVGCDVWSVTSYKELYRDANDCERWNMLHPGEQAKVPYVTQTLKDAQGPFIAASDYMKVLPESLGKWVPGQLVSLGTDGFGRSENRAALRDFFEVDAKRKENRQRHREARNPGSGNSPRQGKPGDQLGLIAGASCESSRREPGQPRSGERVQPTAQAVGSKRENDSAPGGAKERFTPTC